MAGNVEKRQYIKGFDGLRALLALGVVLLHAMQRIQADRTWSQPILDAVANVSWVSVDAFFALSAFLISSIAFANSKTNKFSFGGFYTSRAIRLLPAYIIFIAFYVVATLATGEQPDSIVYLLTYSINWFLPGASQAGFVGHTWTLAVEEQFYLLAPLIVLASRRLLALGLGIAFLACGALRLSLQSEYGFQGAQLYYNTFTRMDPLLAGILLTLCRDALTDRAFRRLSIQLVVYGAGLLCWMFFVSGDTWFYSGVIPVLGPTFTAIFFCGVIGCLLTAQQSRAVQLLEARCLRYAGKVSYGIYLFHMPVLCVLTFGGLTDWWAQNTLTYLALVLATGTFSILSAHCCWVFVERPVMRNRQAIVRAVEAWPRTLRRALVANDLVRAFSARYVRPAAVSAMLLGAGSSPAYAATSAIACPSYLAPEQPTSPNISARDRRAPSNVPPWQ